MTGTTIEVEGIRLAAEMHRPAGSGPHPALCICHGIPAGRTPDPTDGGYPALARRFCSEGFVVLIFNFRGAGESEGDFDIMGWTRDLTAAIDCLAQAEGVDSSRVSVMGFSGGAATAVYCAAHDSRISSVISCACPARFFDIDDFSRVEEFLEHCRRIGIIRNSAFPSSVEEWVRGFEEISPLRWIGKIAPRPVLILHGAGDETVDPGHARELHETAGEPRELAIIEGGGHKLRLSQPAMDAALAWLKKVNGLTEIA